MSELTYLCPKCKSGLASHQDKFVCSGCNEEWEIANGVIRFTRSPSYWNVIPQEKMKTFLRDVRAKGWKPAINNSQDPLIRDLYLFTDCPSRADGTIYLSLTNKSRVLDLGSGWGSYTFALAPKVGEVISADSSLESLEFISARAGQDGFKNIKTVQIEPLDYGKLPFADNSFDAVIMNGVLEWVGTYLKEGDPLKIQEKCLKEVRRVLRPKGELWIGMENRFGLCYLLGAPDDHLIHYSKKGIAYTTLLPRIIASWITRRKLGQPYRNYTHSIWGLKRLLKRAGFAKNDFYFPEEGYRAVAAKIYPIESREVVAAVRKKMQAIWLKLFSLLRLERALCDSFFVVAEK